MPAQGRRSSLWPCASCSWPARPSAESREQPIGQRLVSIAILLLWTSTGSWLASEEPRFRCAGPHARLGRKQHLATRARISGGRQDWAVRLLSYRDRLRSVELAFQGCWPWSSPWLWCSPRCSSAGEPLRVHLTRSRVLTGEADHRPADLRIHLGVAVRWRMLNRRACDSEITTGCQISCPVAVGGARAGRCARRRGPSRPSVAGAGPQR
jgi:hypothetical protein